MIVKTQKPIDFVNTCSAIFEGWQLESAILWKSQTRPVCRLKYVFIYGRYPAISIYGKKIHIHRLLMMWHLKRELESNEYVHHKDENRFNARLSNLELMGASEHQSHTNKGRKQSPQHVFKRIKATVKTRYRYIYETPELVKL